MIYPRPHAKEFAIDAPSSEIRQFDAWERGLGIAFDETNGYPEMESFNGLLQAITQYIKYLEQNGLSEWSADVEYPQGAGCRVGSVWYRAKLQNTGKPPATSQNEWEVFFNVGDFLFSDPLVKTNNTISIKDASTTQKGVARFANNTEIANASNVSAFVNPSNVKSIITSNYNSVSGSRRSPDGFIMKWGTVWVSRDNNASVTFPQPFPNSCFNAQATLNSDSFPVSQDAGCGVTWSRTGLNVRNGSIWDLSISWFAIGN